MSPIAELVWNMAIDPSRKFTEREIDVLKEAAIKVNAYERISEVALSAKSRMRAFNQTERLCVAPEKGNKK